MNGQIPNRAEPASSQGAIEVGHTFKRSYKFHQIAAATCGMYDRPLASIEFINGEKMHHDRETRPGLLGSERGCAARGGD